MSLLAKSAIVILLTQLILHSTVYGQNGKDQHDDLCPQYTTILCVHKALLYISNSTKIIGQIAHQIEQRIVSTI